MRIAPPAVNHRGVAASFTIAFIGRPFVKRFALCYRPIVCLSVCPVCNVAVLWPNGPRQIKMKLGMQVDLDPGHIVLDGDPPPSPKGARPPISGPYLLWPNGRMDQDGTWHGGRPQSRRLCVRWGSSPLPKKGAEPTLQFSAHFYCDQTAGCIKMPLCMEVGRSTGDFVLNGDPAPSLKMGRSPQFSAHVYCGLTGGWIKVALSTEVGLGPGHIVLDGDPAPVPKKGGRAPYFWPILLWPNGWMHQDVT